MNLKIIDRTFAICKVKDYSLVDLNDQYVFISKTQEENSLVCLEENIPSNITSCDRGWKGFYIEGTLDFSLVGILANIATILKNNQIAIFVVSTYNTDYVFIKSENFEKAIKCLTNYDFKIN